MSVELYSAAFDYCETPQGVTYDWICVGMARTCPDSKVRTVKKIVEAGGKVGDKNIQVWFAEDESYLVIKNIHQKFYRDLNAKEEQEEQKPNTEALIL